MNFSDLAKVVKNATDAVHNSETFATPVLAVRARKAAEEYPEDYTIVQSANVLSRMEANGKLFITRGELEGIYNDLYSRNTKFADVFEDEVGKRVLPTPKLMKHDENEENFMEVSLNNMSDPVLANALSEVFEKHGSYKLYSNEIATKAEKACLTELNSIGAPPKSVGVFAGNESFIVCSAKYETPKGISEVLVPVEIKEELALLPTMFLSQSGFVELKAGEINSHIFNIAGKSYNIDGEKVLSALSGAKFGAPQELTDVERAIMKIAASKETPSEHTPEGIVYQQVETPVSDVSVPEFVQDPEVESFAKSLDSPRGAAAFVFGETAVNAGSSLIQRSLTSFGFKGAQVAVADNDDKHIYYAVSLGTAGMKVPVQITNGKAMPPKMAIAAGQIYEFTAPGVTQIFTSENKDVRMMGVASPNYDLKPTEIIKNLKVAMDEQNFVKAEDALAALAAMEDKDAYKAGLAIYMSGLGMENGLTKQASKLEEKVETPILIDYKVFL